jgi:hypothetical protein
MKVFSILGLAALLTVGCQSRYIQHDSVVYKDAGGNPMLLGLTPRNALQKAPFDAWFQTNYNNYVVDSFTCSFIRPLLKDKHITIFFGTWCGDSKREVPRMLRMLDCCGFPPKNLKLILVSSLPDAYKKSPGHEEAGRNIVRVPTLIIEEHGREIGRLIESPVKSLEKDMLAILKQEHYVPNYSNLKAMP